MRRLNEIRINRIAFVDKGANKKDFALFKRLEEKIDNSKNHKKGVNKNMKKLREKYIQAEKVDVSKINADTLDEVIGLLEGIEDEDAKTAAALLGGLKEKYADKLCPTDSEKAIDEAEKETEKTLEEKKFSKTFVESVKEIFKNLKDLRKGIKDVKAESTEVKKFEDENREATPEEITKTFAK